MMNNIGKIGAVGAILATITACLVFFDTYGWVTRVAYAAEHEISVQTQQKTIITSLEALTATLVIIKEEQSKNQDQWECDETDEELTDLGIELLEAETAMEEAPLLRQKAKLDEVWISKKCSRFTD
jgi:hypothetical protein